MRARDTVIGMGWRRDREKMRDRVNLGQRKRVRRREELVRVRDIDKQREEQEGGGQQRQITSCYQLRTSYLIHIHKL